MNWILTASAKRAVLRAAKLADQRAAGDPRSPHLLWALACEESQGADVLARHDIRIGAISAAFFDGSVEFEDSENDAAIATEGFRVSQESVELQYILSSAQGRAARTGNEADTKHLLWAMTIEASPVAEFLAGHGITEATFRDDETEFGEPLPVDFELDWSNPQSGANPPPLAKGGLGGVAPKVDKSPGNPRQTSNRGTPPNPPLVRGGTSSVLRTIDAAANRAREGLRVIEDYIRFELDDPHLTGELKTCRHDLAAALSLVDAHSLVAMRDTPGDVGTRITTDSETHRASTGDVVRANFKRVQEAVRSLEEFGKTLSPDLGTGCEAVRYRLYTIEKAVLTTLHNRERLADCRLYLLLTRDLCDSDPEIVLRDAITGGIDLVQVREKSMSDRELLAWCRHVVDAAKTQALPGASSPPSPLVIVNDRPDIAVLADADGVHVGQEELSVAECRRVVGQDKLIGVSTHNIDQARQAVLDGADYLGVGPVFPSGTKNFDDFPGLDFVGQVAPEITLPWFAIGGITGENIGAVCEAGVTRVAVSGAVCRADDPKSAARRLSDVLRS